jgi:hypothetical protein
MLHLEQSLLLIWGNKTEHWLRYDLLKSKATWETGPRNEENQWQFLTWWQVRNKLWADQLHILLNDFE